jgi:hypothetical protein
MWRGRLAAPHLDFDGDGVHENLGELSQTAILTSFWSSGAEISTASDLARFGAELFEGGLLNAASLAAMRSFRLIDVADAAAGITVNQDRSLPLGIPFLDPPWRLDGP